MQRDAQISSLGSSLARRFCGALLGALVMLGFLGAGLAGCGDDEKAKVIPEAHPSTPYSADDDRPVLQMMTTKIGAKNVFVPSTMVVTVGAGRVLTIYNDTELPHNFTVPGLGIDATLSPGEETQIVLPPLRKPAIYDIRCSLHPPHRHASLVVLDIAK